MIVTVEQELSEDFVPINVSWWPGTNPAAVILSSTFTGTDSTSLNGTSLNVGTFWNNKLLAGGGTGQFQLYQNAAVLASGAGVNGAWSESLRSDGTASGDVTIATGNFTANGLYLRVTDSDNGLEITLRPQSNLFYIIKQVAQAGSVIASAAVTVAQGSTWKLSCTLNGSSITATCFDGSTSTTINGSDTFNQTATMHGILGDGGGAGLGTCVDNFVFTAATAWVTSAYSTFTATDGTNLTAYTPDVGPAWTSGSFTISGNQAVSAISGDQTYQDVGVSNYILDWLGTPGVNGGAAQFLFRVTGSIDYWLINPIAGDLLYLQQRVAGTTTVRASGAWGGTFGNQYAHMLWQNVNNMACFSQGVLICSYSSSLYATATQIGMRNISGDKWDNVRVRS